MPSYLQAASLIRARRSSHTVTVDWGDGNGPVDYPLSVGDTGITISYTYLDDNPSGTPVDINAISVTITDNDSLTDLDNSLAITVNNLKPEISVSDQVVDQGTLLSFFATATDIGTQDTQTYSLDPGAPTDMIIDPVTGEILYAPTHPEPLPRSHGSPTTTRWTIFSRLALRSTPCQRRRRVQSCESTIL